MELSEVPDHLFREKVIQFNSGSLRLELYNLSGGTGGVPRQFVHALVKRDAGVYV